MQDTNQTPHEARQGLYILAQSANALEGLAASLDEQAERYDRTGPGFPQDARIARLLSEVAGLLSHHADAIREASGLNALTQANLDDIKRRL